MSDDRITHDQVREDANDQLHGGRPMIRSGFEAFRATGRQLPTPDSLMYAPPRSRTPPAHR